VKLPAELKPSDVVVVRDSREQNPWTDAELAPLQVITAARDTGDYGLAACPDYVAIERKSLGDLIACCTSERERFERELVRLRAYPIRFLIVESCWQEIERGDWRSKTTPSVIIGSLLAWQCDGLPVLLAGSHSQAAKYAARILFTAARRRWRECRQLAAGIVEREAAEIYTPATGK
jgi:DNA excision repair protein ERCC-4